MVVDARLTPLLCQTVDGILVNTEDSGSITRWNSIKELFIEGRLAHYAFLHPDLVLCHPANRGGLGLNGYNCHLLMEKLGRVGVDLSELKNATCMQLSNQRLCQKQLDFNTSSD